MSLRSKFHTVTFDCWQTLLYEEHAKEKTPSHIAARVKVIEAWTGKPADAIGDALAAAWIEHQRAWHRRQVFAGPEMTRHVLTALGVEMEPARIDELVHVLEDEITVHRIVAVEGARELLEGLRAEGVRVALICDTGFSPGRVVRQLLSRVGLLDLLEVQIFSDEIRVPKPHPRAFHAALEGLGVSASGAAHVGDLRRSDIAGARAVGMATVRFTGRNDDADSVQGAAGAGIVDCTSAGCVPACPRPEADVVIARYDDLPAWLASGN